MRMLDADALAEAIGVKRLMIQSWEPDSAWGVPIVDAEPVVRCKDCKHCFVDGDNVRFNLCLLNHNKVQSDDWYCADGERREEEQDEGQ